ncbi:hypothetical protein [Sphingobacterium athyrii]|uniref:Uncharacterized protein n=1 Tax=Sphingobacterium athyrii TaxID=2152717 RepID=A0A363NUE2_9SPHI|nr:hypothetical protein [Sphingobacterium athyrii]PUV24343.1 hypothetical protein DCO56_13440 [Sphingobacterium athyrii]
MNSYSAFTILFGLLLIQACHSPMTKREDTSIDSVATKDSSTLLSKDSTDLLRSASADSSKGQIFLVRSYRIWEKEDPTAVLNKDWFDLFEREGKYYLEKVDYEIKDGYDECAQVPSKSVESKRNSLLFLNIKGLKPGALENMQIKHSEIWPKESVEYNFRKQHIILKGLGDIKSTEVQTDEKGHEKIFHEVAHYKLNVVFGGTHEMTLFQKDQYEHVFMSTQFVGDIDRDGQLDFIFSNPGNYEEEALLLFLSNGGKPLIFEANEQFDC